MAENNGIIDVNVNMKALVMEAKTAAVALRGLDKVLSSIGEGVRDAFSIRGLSDYRDTVTRFGKDLADALLTLQLSFGSLKVAIADAVAPIASVFVPMLNTAIQAVIRFAGIVGQFLRGVLAGITGNKGLADSAKEATQSEVKLGSAAKAAGKAVKRSLASFDQLERLNEPTGSGGSGGSVGGVDIWGGFAPDPISPQVQALVDRVLAVLAPLMAIDLTPLRLSLQNLWTAFTQLAAVVGEALSFLWYEILTPFIAWILEILEGVYQETAQALSLKHNFPLDEQMAFTRTSKRKLQDYAIVDFVERNARDPMRKLGPDDRLVGSARLVYSYGIMPENLCTAIAAAIFYPNTEDPFAIELRTIRETQGVDGVLSQVCKLDPAGELGRKIKEKIEMLRKAGYLQ